MADDSVKNTDPMSREERLAAKLRENLRRRKTQARQIDGAPKDEREESLPKTGGES